MRADAATLRRDAFHAGLACIAAIPFAPESVVAAYEASIAALSTKDRVKVAHRVGLFSDEMKAGRIPKCVIEKTLALDLDGQACKPAQVGALVVTIDACWVEDDVAVVMDWSDPSLDTLGLASRGLAWAANRGMTNFRWIVATVSGSQVTYAGSPVFLEMEAESLWSRVRTAHVNKGDKR